MTTKSQRLQRRIAQQHGEQFALERAVLNAARALVGSHMKYGRYGVADAAWDRFVKAENALHEFHAEKARGEALQGKAGPERKRPT